jgi:hypothetical protein
MNRAYPNTIMSTQKTTYCVLYSYFETDKSKKNLTFFLQNGIVENDDIFYVFIVNNDTYQVQIPPQENINVMTRKNLGHDFGSWKHGLESLDKPFDYYIFMNDTVCGPFLPRYIPKMIPWYQMFCNLLSDVVKLSGLTINYFPWGRRENNWEHVQSMMFCTDKIGVDILKKEIFHYSLEQFEDIYNKSRSNFIIQFEIGLSKCIIQNGFEIAALYYADIKKYKTGDIWYNNKYFNTTVNAFETMFLKTNRVNSTLIEFYIQAIK